MSYPLGVDVGTTYTAAALWRDGRVETVPLGNRANAVPSVAYLREDGTMLIGEAAVRRGLAEPDRAAREFKRRMGDEVPILLGGRGFAAHELTGHVLRWAVERVSELQSGPPSHIVLTHPAEWGDYRRGLYVEAARTAGFTNVGLLPEPVAAATWYASQERVEPGALIGIYDFGGGTFDASVVRKTTTGMEIHGEAGGDDSIGGVDFDHALLRHVCSSAGVDVSSLDFGDQAVAAALAQLLASVVEAKEALSADVEVVVPVMLPGLTRQVLVTRADFESLIRTQVLGTVGVFGRVVRRAGVDPSALHAVLLVGGSSRIPLVRDLLSAELGIRVAVDAHPKYTVCLGAAIAAAPRVVATAPPTTAPPPSWPPPPAASTPPPTAAPPATPPFAVPRSAAPPPTAPSPWLTGPAAGEPGRIPGAGPTVKIETGPAPVAQEPAVAERVNLADTGLTAATDVRIVIPQIVVTPPTPAGQPVVLRTRDAASSRGRGRLAVLGIVLLVVVVVAVAVVLATRGDDPEDPGQNAGPGPGGQIGSSVGTVGLTGGLVAPPEGADAMRGAAALANGDRVFVGTSLQLAPRAWISRAGGAPTPVDIPADQQGAVADVAAARSGAVAVGWTGTGPARRPAVWTSPDGASWQLAGPSGDFAPGSGIAELTAVTALADGTLLAAAIDRKLDPADGDIALYRSPDGSSWSRAASTGLDGPGPQVAQRLSATGTGLVAVGAALAGARRGPAIWTSPDGATWQLSPFVPDGSPTLWAVATLPDGSLITCGSIGSADRPSVGCWTQSDQQRWDPYTVTGSPTPLYLYALLPTGTDLTAVGTGQLDATVDAATWTARIEAR